MSQNPGQEINGENSTLPPGLEIAPGVQPARVRTSEVVIILLIILLCLCLLGSAMVILMLIRSVPNFLQNLFGFIPAIIG